MQNQTTQPLLLLPAPQPTLNLSIREAVGDYRVRKNAAKVFRGFSQIYFHTHLTLKPALFHTEMTDKMGDHSIQYLEIIGCRDSAKSTFGSMALPIWAALEHPELYPFIIIICDTGTQASIAIANIKAELENNHILLQDYGRIKVSGVSDFSPETSTFESDDEWQARNMVLANGVRILARSRGQKIRGLKHRQHRPKLVIVDDPEDSEWTKTKENRNNTERWIRGEVIPGMDKKTGRMVLIGNYLHDDAIMMRAKKWGIFLTLEYPLIDPRTGDCNWPAKYPTKESLEMARKAAGEVSWQREYLLKVVPEEGQEIVPDDITYYNEMPDANGEVLLQGHGVDLAISEKTSADYTAIVTGKVRYDESGKPKIFIMPRPVNEHFKFYDTIATVKAMNQGGSHIWFVEDVAFQKAAIQELERVNVPVQPIKPASDKRSRLKVAAIYIRNGTVQFPREGCQELLNQVFNFGVESHDDLVDALVYLILGFAEMGLELPTVVWF